MATGHGGDAFRFPFWSFREDVYIESGNGTDTLVVHSRWEDVAIPVPRPRVYDALRRMSLGPISLANVITERSEREEFDRLLDRLDHLVVRSLGYEPERPLISVVPLTQQARFRLPAVSAELPVRMSRFVMIQTDGRNYYLESPLSLHRVLLHRPDALDLIASLSRPGPPEAIQMADARTVIAYLMAAEMVVQARAGGTAFAEDDDPALAGWTPLDLMFHARSTLGRHDYDFGATYPMGDQVGVEPVVKRSRSRTRLSLRRPGWDELLSADPPLTVVLEAARHMGECGGAPVSADDLGTLLYRVARVRSLIGSSSEAATDATSDRPYVSIGDCYELELYVTLGDCAGIPRGIYHYDPLGHQLEVIDSAAGDVDEILENGRVAANLAAAPAVLITVTARFRRLSWKYNGLSYALVLKNVGVLTQTLSLAGAAMGLCVALLDIADIETSTRVFGTDWRAESTVGAVVVGGLVKEVSGGTSGKFAINDAEWVDRALRHVL